MSDARVPLPVMWWIKFFFICLAVVFAICFTIPSFMGDPKEWPRDAGVNGEAGVPKKWIHRAAEQVLPSSRIAMGLDLKGGLHLVLEVDVEKSLQDSVSRAFNRAGDILKVENITLGIPNVTDKLVATVQASDPSKKDAIIKAVSDQSNLVIFDRVDGSNFIFAANSPRVSEFSDQLLSQAISTIRNRIDQFGVSEPSIFKQGDRRVVVQMPGIQDPERAKTLIGNTALLDFRMVLNELSADQLTTLLDEGKKALGLPADDTKPDSIRKVSAWMREGKKISAGATVLLERQTENEAGVSKVISARPYLVELQSKLTGDLIESADAQRIQENLLPEEAVSLKFNPQGSKAFGDLTTAAAESKNAPHQIAIVLDDNITSAPTVNGPILGGSARITMGRGTNPDVKLKEAQDLALVLRAGALPASVKVIEERQVGPSEGEQNIRAGVVSSLVAAGLVILFMVLIYGVSGIVANVAMLLNVFLILGLLALFGATLTLPGIAGIVLTMAVAVDGNVIINERIREEINAGATTKTAFYKGYEHSFVTLVDAHFTSAIAGVVLLIYGNAATKGFAVTLLAGIVSTLFTSFYVTEVIGQWIIERTKIKRFS